MASERQKNVYLAKLSEQAERYDEMVKYMNQVVKDPSSGHASLSVEERNLLSVAYKNVVGARRASLRIVLSILSKEEEKKSQNVDNVKSYRHQIEDELDTICNEILDLLDTQLIPAKDDGAPQGVDNEAESEAEPAVFYYKMKGDYCRYLAEFKQDDAQTEVADKAKAAYYTATYRAEKLSATNPIRLGLALNFSVFAYEVQKDHTAACELAKSAFDDAISYLDTLDEESYKDSTLIMQLLRDNLTLWREELVG